MQKRFINPEILILTASNELEAYAKTHTEAVAVGFLESIVKVFPQREMPAHFNLAMVLTARQVCEGLTSPEWDRLGRRLVETFERFVICQTPPKL